MKVFSTIMKILVALAAVAGAIYIAATYGDKIVAWAKKILASCPCCDNTCDCVCEGEGECQCGDECKCEGEGECQCEAPAEEVAEEAPVEEIVIEENEPVAEEADFAE